MFKIQVKESLDVGLVLFHHPQSECKLNEGESMWAL